MSVCFIFSGTSEGRELSEALSMAGEKCHVFVATEYGNTVMSSHENINVNVGRLDSEEIKKLIEEKVPDYIVDATHPHATVISENIKKACKETCAQDKYIRVTRTIEKSDVYDNTVIKVKSNEEAVKALNMFPEGNILLTTGVKELKSFCLNELKDRLIVRVLPSVESLNEVSRFDIKLKNVIAMEGPFTEEMNKAFINQYDVKVLVTKNSGDRGGYKEKINACTACGIKAIVIEKDFDESRVISVNDAVNLITGKPSYKKHIYLASASICDEKYLTKKSFDAIKHAEVIIGAKRMIEFAQRINRHAQYYIEYMPAEVSEIIKSVKAGNIVVLFSGDTGLCSGAKGVYEKLKDNGEIYIEIIPGVSSVSYFASKLHIQYSDYPFVTLHGKACNYMNVLKEEGGFISICSGVSDVKMVADDVIKFNSSLENPKHIYVGYNLGSEEEKIYEINTEIPDMNEGLYVMAVV
ncbi:MAG: precorrin-6A reductase [Lachnospiraceae bacterium]|nr:precorrin-6A reductase [Lachnospiraceae bacterium]